MKQTKFTEKQLIKKIKNKKELSGLADSVVGEALDDYIKKHNLVLKKLPKAQIKILVKEIRAELRYLTGQFQKTLKDKTKLLEKNNLSNLLKTHSSTAERLGFYSRLKKIIYALKVKSILDLGWGLNPIALASQKIKYYASDIKEDELSLIKEYFKKEKIKGKTFVYDLRKINFNLPEADLCLLLKVLDLLKDKYKTTEKILKKVPCKYILVSFSTKKLSGKPMTYPKRFWFEKLLTKLKLPCKKFKTTNEIFYLVYKNQGNK